MTTKLVVFVALSASSCLCGETTITLDPPSGPIAVTASAAAHLTSRRCSEFPFDNRGNIKPHVTCSSEGVPVEVANVDDPTLLEVAAERSLVHLKALAPGTTTVRAQANGVSYATEVEARRVNRVQLQLGCDDGADGLDGGAPAGAVFPAGATFRVSLTSFAGDTPLLGMPEAPVSCDVATSQPGSTLTFVASAVAARGSMSSRHDANLSVPVRVFTANEFTVDMPQPTTEWGLSTATFRAYVLVDGRRPCIDDFERHFEIITPEVCIFRSGGAPLDAGTLVEQQDRPFGVIARRLSAGVCTVQVVFPARPDLTAQRSHTF